MPKKNLFYGNSVLEEVCGGDIAIKKTFWHTGKEKYNLTSKKSNVCGKIYNFMVWYLKLCCRMMYLEALYRGRNALRFFLWSLQDTVWSRRYHIDHHIRRHSWNLHHKLLLLHQMLDKSHNPGYHNELRASFPNYCLKKERSVKYSY